MPITQYIDQIIKSEPIDHITGQKKMEDGRFDFSNDQGMGSLKKIAFQNIQVAYGEFKVKGHQFVKTKMTKPTIEMFFSFSGNCCISYACEPEVLFLANQHNLMYFLGNQEYSFKTYPENESYRFLHISFMSDYFEQLVDKDDTSLASFKSKIKIQQVALLNEQHMPITFEMNVILKEIMQCKKKGLLKHLFIKAKIFKLLILQFEQFEALHAGNKPYKPLKDPDVHKVHQAKKLLDKSISTSVTLIELAHQSGLNDFKLKKGFKEIYGTTVYGYLYELRMQEAKKRLLNSTDPVNEISMQCGYSSIQSFIKAFKRKFGLPPEKFRNT